MRVRMENKTDDTIEIEPGESLDIFGEKAIKRLMSTRREIFTITDLGDKDSVERVLCLKCGDQVPKQLMELSLHECD